MQGRCAGCGETGPERQVTAHLASCARFAQLYREHPERALPPAREYRRWREQEKAAEQEERIAARITATGIERSVMADRFRTPPDILEDE